MISVLISRLVLLVFGTLYPAYASYKTVKVKNVKEYVRWMMYWIVFALYTFIEIFADIFVAFWFPFYYELKIIFVLWLVCPATKGSSYVFMKVINPQLSKHEVMIDSYIAALWDQGYDLARKIGAQGIDYLIEISFELLRKGQITVNSLIPKLNEVAQDVNNTQNMKSVEYISSENATDEDFVFMTEDNLTDSENAPLATSKPKLETRDSCSESEDNSSKKSRSEITTRRKRASVSKERTRAVKTRSKK